ncbi:MAG: SIMPL domain-containing protein [Phycisphaerales bacterium]
MTARRTGWKGVVSAAIVGGLAIGSLAMFGAAGPEDATRPAPDATRVNVVGSGEVSVEPDRAQITLGATAQADTASDAQRQVNEILGKLIADVKDLDVEGMMLQTSQISLSPVYESGRGRDVPRIVGYRASNTVMVRVDDVKRVGDVVDVAVEHGANESMGISFQLRNPERAQLEALRRAVTTARAKADAVAGAMGMKVERVEEVSEQGAEPPRPVYAARGMEMMAMDASATPVESGQITVRAQVTMTCRLGQ